MEQLELKEMECLKDQLQEMIKPYQQEQNQRQKKADFLKRCVRCIEKNDFFQLEELLNNKQAKDVLEESNFKLCDSVFCELKKFARAQVDSYCVKFKGVLLDLAKEAEIPLEVDFPRFFVVKGIEGSVDFSTRSTVLNQLTIKTVDPKRIISAIINLKRKLYDSPFEPQKFIDSLLQCYKEILKEEKRGMGDAVPIHQLYNDYVWSLQSSTFFQNMDKGKFKGYSIEQFAVDLWRFFQSNVSSAEGGYCISLNPGRIKSFWLIDQKGERRHITNASFVKN